MTHASMLATSCMWVLVHISDVAECNDVAADALFAFTARYSEILPMAAVPGLACLLARVE